MQNVANGIKTFNFFQKKPRKKKYNNLNNCSNFDEKKTNLDIYCNHILFRIWTVLLWIA